MNDFTLANDVSNYCRKECLWKILRKLVKNCCDYLSRINNYLSILGEIIARFACQPLPDERVSRHSPLSITTIIMASPKTFYRKGFPSV